MNRVLTIAGLVCAAVACMPSFPEIPAGCRSFSVTTWAQNDAPWNEVDWQALAMVDEPMLWWHQNAPNPEPGRPPTLDADMDEVRSWVREAKAAGREVWVNWSTEELKWLGPNPVAGQDVTSFDNYEPLATFPLVRVGWNRIESQLDDMHANLAAGQTMALVPLAYVGEPSGHEDEDTLILRAALYWEWAMRHDRIRAFAPFRWGDYGGMTGIENLPRLRSYLASLSANHPRCN